MPTSSGAPARSTLTAKVRRGPGRPRKFGRPSRVVAVTLPEDVIDRLAALDTDLGTAIVRLIDRHPGVTAPAAFAAEVASYGAHAVIVVPPFRKLGKLAGVELVPIGGNRALISLDGAHRVPQFELALRDALDHDDMTSSERRTLDGIADILRDARRSGKVTIAERTIIVLQARRERNSNRKVPR